METADSSQSPLEVQRAVSVTGQIFLQEVWYVGISAAGTTASVIVSTAKHPSNRLEKTSTSRLLAMIASHTK